MKLHEFLLSHARGQGKTHNLCEILKKVDGTLIVRDEREAKRVNEMYGIKSFSYREDPKKFLGMRFGITYIDPDAMGCWINDKEREIDMLKQNLDETEKLVLKYAPLSESKKYFKHKGEEQ